MPTSERFAGLPHRVWLHKLKRITVMMSLAYSICGCAPDEPNPFYSGNFAVVNEGDKTVVIKGWANFGEAQPAEGFIVPGAGNGKSSFFPKLERFPESTVVSWVLEDDQEGEVFSQEINLKGVVPQNTEGQTEFILGEDGVWTVRFVPAVE